VGGENSSSKAFGISFADRPKAKSVIFFVLKIYIDGIVMFDDFELI
jgi:hypothetical protein